MVMGHATQNWPDIGYNIHMSSQKHNFSGKT